MEDTQKIQDGRIWTMAKILQGKHLACIIQKHFQIKII